ncbi:aminoglycoside phosphotransferase family protein [Phycicoccus jejuensis]|uniref:phosphotransferase n=1 Tax=Phycicoccus jejuensis TaxID=367299 RepID=UPI0004C4146E|nr:aminoglycoside phosphotransferase family protein [Phycicoccus jejuensis]
MPLNPEQQQLVDQWLPGACIVADLSWGLVDTTVLHLRWAKGEVIVKAAGPKNHHLWREITGHLEFTAPWLSEGRVGRLLRHNRDLNVLVLEYLPGVLADGTSAATDPETHRQAGALLAALHRQASRIDDQYETQMDARALRWLDGDHRIDPRTEARVREVIAGHDRPPAVLVPTHGDWQPRNWLVDGGCVLVIDLGRADWRPALTDLARLSRQQWDGRTDLEAAFLAGYGADPREPGAWRRTLLREAIGTACWAYQVGDEPFEQQGHRMLLQCLAMAP